MKNVFVSVVPDNKEKEMLLGLLSEKKEVFPRQAVKWADLNNLHLTVLFLGRINTEREEDVFCSVEKSLEGLKLFSVLFSSLCYYPSKDPHMIILKGSPHKSFLLIRDRLKGNLKEKGVRYMEDDREFLTHITLGRLSKWEFRKMEREEVPDMKEDVSFNLQVNSVSVMESIQKRGSVEYKTLKSFSLVK